MPETLIGQEVYRSGAYSRMKGVVVAVNVRYKDSSFYPDTDYDMVIVGTLPKLAGHVKCCSLTPSRCCCYCCAMVQPLKAV